MGGKEIQHLEGWSFPLSSGPVYQGLLVLGSEVTAEAPASGLGKYGVLRLLH